MSQDTDRKKELAADIAQELHRVVGDIRTQLLPGIDLLTAALNALYVAKGLAGVTLQSVADVTVWAIWRKLPKHLRNPDYGEVKYIRGICGSHEHSWITYTVPAEDVGASPATPFRFIIDPAMTECLPGCLLLTPYAPAQMLYREMVDLSDATDPADEM